MILKAFNRKALHHTNMIIRLSQKRVSSDVAQNSAVQELALLAEKHFKQPAYAWHVSLSPTHADEGCVVVYLSVPLYFADEVRDWLRDNSQRASADAPSGTMASPQELSIEPLGTVKSLAAAQQRQISIQKPPRL